MKKQVNVYQARNGGIYIALGDGFILLEKQQVKDLNINLHNIEDFNVANYHKFYEAKEKAVNPCCQYFISKLDRIEAIVTEE